MLRRCLRPKSQVPGPKDRPAGILHIHHARPCTGQEIERFVDFGRNRTPSLYDHKQRCGKIGHPEEHRRKKGREKKNDFDYVATQEGSAHEDYDHVEERDVDAQRVGIEEAPQIEAAPAI